MKRLAKVETCFALRKKLSLVFFLQNESEYLKYFWWKEHYVVHGVVEAKDRAFCDLCEKLHKQTAQDGGYGIVKSEASLKEGIGKYKDFVSWFKKDKCWPSPLRP